MPMLPHEVLAKMKLAKSKNEKVKLLKDNESWALKDIIRGSMDSSIEWNLPGGAPPYTKCEPHNAPTSILREHKKFGYFIKGGPGDKLPAYKRETMFIGILEGIHPDDADLVIAMINKEAPKPCTKPIVQEAFPGLLQA
jgi:hypothetical protein